MVLRALSEAIASLDLTGRRVLVACSGGVDSTVLFRALEALAGRHHIALALGHVHHGLRGADAEADLEAVRGLGAKFGVAVEVDRLDPQTFERAGPSRARLTLQEAARAARYAALRRQAARLGFDRIATAHTRDDQAETVLLRLLRGAGPDSLGGIPERSRDGWIVRPLLGVGRDEIEAYAHRAGLSWREDVSNESRGYARNRLRHDWLPGLGQAFNPRLSRALADLAEAARRDAEWIEATIEAECARWTRVDGDSHWISPDPWPAMPEALARRLVRELLRRAGGGRDVSRKHLLRALTFLRTARIGTRVELPGGLQIARARTGYRIGPAACPPRGSC